MEFHEKLQTLRKNKGLTQEELAEALFVSRTAISKWESGRGYPSIDSLKEISKYFSVTIDDLLSVEKLLSIAEKENKDNIQDMCDLLFGIVDLFSFVLILLPLYPNTVDGYIYSVNLIAYTEINSFYLLIHWMLFITLVAAGFIKILMIKRKTEKNHTIVTFISIGVSILIVLFLAMSREAYATSVAFLLLVVKSLLLFKFIKTSC